MLHAWTPPSVAPRLVAWVALLLLLLLKPNRQRSAWWICVPIAWLFVSEFTLRSIFHSIPSDALEILCLLGSSLTLGLAGLWLVSPFLTGNHRFLVFLKTLVALTALTMFFLLTKADLGYAGAELFGSIVSASLLVAALTSALILAGRNCRYRFHTARLLLWFLVWLSAFVSVLVLPLAMFAALVSGPEVLPGMALALVTAVGLAWALAFPFLVLSFVNRFYRQRLSEWLQLERSGPPSEMISVPPPVFADSLQSTSP